MPLSLTDPGASRSSRKSLPLLTDAEQAEAGRVAQRLVGELREVVRLLPEPDRSASAMSRALSLDRATCQRLVSAIRVVSPDAEVLVGLPGVQGLRQFLAAASGTLGEEGAQSVVGAGAAVDRFEDLIERLGGSQRALRARIAAERASRPEGLVPTRCGADELPVRASLFRAAAAATGRWSEAVVEFHAIRPVKGRPGVTEGFRARVLSGHRASPDSVPLEIGQTSPLHAADRQNSSSGAPLLPVTLVEEFCSSPLPKFVSRGDARREVHVIDIAHPAGSDADDAVDDDRPDGTDIAIADRAASIDRHPATLRPPVGEVWHLVNFPTRALVFDVLLHKEIARRCIPSLELHLWTPDVVGPQGARWSTRFAGGPRLEILGAGLQRSASRAYARLVEFQSTLLARAGAGWEPSEFIGYRCEVAFPLWRAGYCMSFDFTGSEVGAE